MRSRGYLSHMSDHFPCESSPTLTANPKSPVRPILITDLGVTTEIKNEAGVVEFTLPRYGAWAPRYRGADRLECVDTGELLALQEKYGPNLPVRTIASPPLGEMPPQ